MVTRFFLMPESENEYGCRAGLVPVERHISGVSEGNEQFAQVWLVVEGPPYFGVGFEQQEVFCDGLTGSARCLGAFFRKELPASFQSAGRTLRNNYSWHSGMPGSSAVPQPFRQSRTSPPVRCSPFS